MSALVIAFPHGALIETRTATVPVDAVANVQGTADELRARYICAFEVFLDAALALEKLDKGSDRRLEKDMNYAQSHAASILERLRIEAKLANYERRGLTATKDYLRQRRFRVREADSLRMRDERGWVQRTASQEDEGA
jgi:hypothetical protein